MSEAGSKFDSTMRAMRRGPLDATALPGEPGFAAGVVGPSARFILRGDAEIASIAGAALGAELPLRPNRASQPAAGGRFALWLGPDEWLLGAPGEDAENLATNLGAALAGRAHSLVEVSHRQIGLALEGPAARRALSAGCPLDLRLVAFPVGMATRTLFLKAEIILWRQANQRFHVEVWRSFAPYLAGHLAEIAGDAVQA